MDLKEFDNIFLPIIIANADAGVKYLNKKAMELSGKTTPSENLTEYGFTEEFKAHIFNQLNHGSNSENIQLITVTNNAYNVVFVDVNNWIVFYNKVSGNIILVGLSKPETSLSEEDEQRLFWINTVNKITNDAIYDWDIEKDELLWNDGLTKIFGHDEVEIENNIDWWKSMIHPEDIHKVFAGLENAIENNYENWEEEYRFKTKTGTFVYVFDKGTFIKNKYGKTVRMIGGMKDITERKNIEFKLLEKNRKLSEIAFFNSHKLRSPLARVSGLVSILEMEEDKGNTTDIISKLSDAVKELETVVSEIGRLTDI